MKHIKNFLGGYKTYDTTNGFGSSRQWRNSFHKRMTGQEADEILRESKESPWSILGVPFHASPDQIKKAFRKLVMEWHPDRNQHRIEQAEAMTKKIIAAYTKLTT